MVTLVRSVWELQLQRRFEELSKRLLDDADPRRLALPLAHWVSPRDRGLPRMLLRRPGEEIARTPFARLAGTRGVGPRKLALLIQLLERILEADSPPPSEAYPRLALRPAGLPGSEPAEAAPFDPEAVTEAAWAAWCAAVRQHGLDREPLGRFAASLRSVPRGLWRTPLAEYAGATLEEIRSRKAHGRHRVRAIVEAFHAAMSAVGSQPSAHVAVRFLPRRLAPVENWLQDVGNRRDFPEAAEVRERFVEPLMDQLRTDVPELVKRVVAERLPVPGRRRTARQTAAGLRLSRARVY